MKTKIIYISGNEVFDMADIRAAFDTVRGALGLDNDTILFGVPVDADDAFSNDIKQNTVEPVIEPGAVSDTPVAEPDHENTTTTIETEKPKKTSNRRQKVVPITPIDDDSTDMADNVQTEQENQTDVPAIPILSVLGAKDDSVVDSTPNLEESIEPTPISVVSIDEHQSETTENDTGDAATIKDNETQTVSINDMLADDSEPVSAHEKTLEELLESMTPLGEDEPTSAPVDNIVPESVQPDELSEPTASTGTNESDDTDATLELLATEFAESADEIVTPTKPAARRIGKLKNILPFKPKNRNRNDDGIMGDLFGWAGVANDEDFSIPGFFANASSKK